MAFPELHLWERAALRPPPQGSRPRQARKGRASAAKASAQDLGLARRHSARTRAATARGLILSLVLSVPMGWTFARSSFLADEPSVGEECPSLALFLAPDIQRSVHRMKASGELSRAQRNTLDVKVCSSTLASVLRPLLGDLSDAQGLRDMAAGAGAPGNDAATLPLLKSLLSQSGARSD